MGVRQIAFSQAKARNGMLMHPMCRFHCMGIGPVIRLCGQAQYCAAIVCVGSLSCFPSTFTRDGSQYWG